MVINILMTYSCWQVDEKKWMFHLCHVFFRLLSLSGFLRYDFQESGMKYNILSGQILPSWVFGFSGFQSAPPNKTTLPKGDSMGPELYIETEKLLTGQCWNGELRVGTSWGADIWLEFIKSNNLFPWEP